MGSPELPGESENNLSTNGTHITNYAQNTSEDSDVEDDNIYEGYEPLPMGETIDFDNSLSNDENQPEDSNLPNIISSDIEIAQQVWNEPSPRQEIELDTSKTAQIMSAMATITLPTTAIPDWAQVVPEEKWKQDLLDRIRQRNEPTNIENKTN